MKFHQSWLALRELLARLARSLKRHFILAAVISVGWAIIGFLWNLWSLALVQGGFDLQATALIGAVEETLRYTEFGREILDNESVKNAVSKLNPGRPSYWFDIRNYTYHDRRSDGVSFWTFLPLLASFAFGYLWTAGPRRFVRDLFRLPSALLGIVRKEPGNALTHILWGAGLGLLLTRTFNPMLQAGLLLTLTATLPTVLGQTISRFVARVLFDLARLIKPGRQWKESNIASLAIAAIGGIIALVLAGLVHPEQLISRALLGGLLIAAAVVTAKRGAPKHVTTLLVVCGVGFEIEAVLAHDGGWKEPFRGQRVDLSRDNLETYLQSKGADRVVSLSRRTGATAGVAGGVGTVLGGAAGENGMGWDRPGGAEPPSGDEPYNEEHERILDDLWQEVDDEGFISRVETIFDRIERTGNIDPDELARLQADWEGELDRRRVEIDAEQERWSEEQRDKREDREDEARERREEAAAQERRRRDMLRRGRGLIGRVEDPVRAQQLEDFLARHAHDPDSLEEALAAIRAQVFEAQQQRNMGEAEEAEAESDAYRESENYARSVRDNAQRVNRGLSRLVPGGSRIVAAQDTLYQGIEDYDRDGVRGVITGAATNMVDDRTGGLGSALRDARNEGGTAAERARNAAGNWWHNATDDKNPVELGRRVANADGLGDIVDVALDSADARDDWRGDGDSDHDRDLDRPAADRDSTQRTRSENGSETTSPPPPGAPNMPTSPPDNRPQGASDTSASRPSTDEPSTPRRDPLYDQTETSTRDRDTAPQTPPDPYRNPDPPAHPNDPDYQRRTAEAQEARNTWAEVEQARERESEAQRRAGQTEMDRDIARERAVESRQEVESLETEAETARRRAQAARDEAEANRRALDDARTEVRSDEPIPGAVDRYEEAQRRQAELDARVEAESQQETEAENRLAGARQQHQQRGQELRQASEDENRARQEHETARQEAEQALAQQRAARDPRHEMEQANHGVEESREALNNARREAERAEQSGDQSRQVLAQDALTRAQEQLQRSEEQQRLAREQLGRHIGIEAERQREADQANRDAQARRGVTVAPMGDPGQHREVTSDRMRTERAHDNAPEVPITRVVDQESGVEVAIDPNRQSHPDARQETEPMPNFDGRNVRGQHQFDDQGRPDSTTVDNDGTRLHERIHAAAHERFRRIFPAGMDRTRNFHEGLTEYFAQQTMADQMIADDRRGVYPNQMRAVEDLVRRVGHGTVAEAYFNGNTQALTDRLGGRDNLVRYNDLLRDGKYNEARDFLDQNVN